jgi:hypothetical protein
VATIRIVSGRAISLAIALLTIAATFGLWVLTQPMIESFGIAKYLLIPVYFLVSLVVIIPMLASLFVFFTIVLAQASLFKALGAKPDTRASKPRPVEYREYDDETREYVKKTGYF